MTKLNSLESSILETPASKPTQSGAQGFTGRLQGASLFDLVQLECLAGTHHVVRVISRSQTGYLYFDRGNLVHAVCHSLTGEAAAIEILGWQHGLFEPCDVPWPTVPSITKHWQNLLLLAAQVGDESRHAAADGHPTNPTMRSDSGGKILEFPSDRGVEQSSAALHQQRGPSVSNDPSSSSRMAPESETSGIAALANGRSSSLGASGSTAPALPRPTSLTSAAPAKPPSISNTLVQAAVRLDAAGNVLTSRGNGQELAGAVSYSTRIAQLIADALGLGSLSSIEYETERYRSFIHRESDGQLLAVRANRDVDLSRIKDKLGL